MSLEMTIESIARATVEEHIRSRGVVVQEYLSPNEASIYLGLSVKQLELWRATGEGPAFTKLARAVRYSRADLDEFMASQKGGLR